MACNVVLSSLPTISSDESRYNRGSREATLRLLLARQSPLLVILRARLFAATLRPPRFGHALRELCDELAIKCGDIGGLSAGYQPAVHYYFAVLPCPAGVADIGLQ